jgi:hypothetical protein
MACVEHYRRAMDADAAPEQVRKRKLDDVFDNQPPCDPFLVDKKNIPPPLVGTARNVNSLGRARLLYRLIKVRSDNLVAAVSPHSDNGISCAVENLSTTDKLWPKATVSRLLDAVELTEAEFNDQQREVPITYAVEPTKAHKLLVARELSVLQSENKKLLRLLYGVAFRTGNTKDAAALWEKMKMTNQRWDAAIAKVGGFKQQRSRG